MVFRLKLRKRISCAKFCIGSLEFIVVRLFIDVGISLSANIFTQLFYLILDKITIGSHITS